MDREAHALILAGILADPSNVAGVSDNLTILSEDYAAIIAENASVLAENTMLKQRNQELIDQNMKLFLKQAAVPEPEEPEIPEVVIPDLESLFDASGKLK